MTVRNLIKELRKLDPDLEVGFKDHDADPYTISSWINNVNLVDFDLISHEVNYMRISGKNVVLTS